MAQRKWHHEPVLEDDNSWVIFYFHGETSGEFVEAYTPVSAEIDVAELDERIRGCEPFEMPLEFVVYQNSDAESEAESHDEFLGTGIARRKKHGDDIVFEVDKDTIAGFAYALLTEPGPYSLRLFNLFSRIAPQSFHDSISTLFRFSDQSANGTRRFSADRTSPATIPDDILKEEQLLALLRDPDARISYRQLYMFFYCKEQTMRGYLVKADLVPSGPRLTNVTFSTAELVSHLLPSLQRRRPQGEKIYLILRMLDKAGHLSQYRID